MPRRRLLLFVGLLLWMVLNPVRSQDSGVPRFVDVTEEAGIDFRHVSGERDRKEYIFEAKGGGIGFFDYDGDGRLDLLIAQGSTVEAALRGEKAAPGLFRNLGDGRFAKIESTRSGLVGGIWGMGVAFGDYDNDGDPDIYLTQLGPDRLYRNNGDGTFTDVTSASGIAADGWSTTAAFGDYDGDGDLDLYVAGYLNYDYENLPPRTTDCTYLGEPVLCGPRGLAGARDYLYRNDGEGRFTDVTRDSGAWDREHYYGLSALWSDLDRDGDPDLLVGNDATPNLLFVNEGGSFEEWGFLSGLAVSGDGNEQASMGVDSGDYDNDGLPDVFFTHFASDYSTLYRNDGDLLFRDVSDQAGFKETEWFLVSWGVRFLDLNFDGWKDILHANGHVYPYLLRGEKKEAYLQGGTLLVNQKDGTFADRTGEAGGDFREPIVGRGVAFGDYDNDGDLDIAVANLNGEPRLLRCDRKDSNHWIMLRLEGSESSRDALGAWVEVEAGDLSQSWEIKRTVGIYSASDPRAHFGLGASETIDRLQVRWPNGELQAFEDVAVDRHYFLRQDRELIPDPRVP